MACAIAVHRSAACDCERMMRSTQVACVEDGVDRRGKCVANWRMEFGRHPTQRVYSGHESGLLENETRD
jgi:hypothetical protein